MTLTLRGMGRLMGVLAMTAGLATWLFQMKAGLEVTGLGNQVVWGLYIGNFLFLVGIAASAVVLMVPVHFFARQELAFAAVIGECLALASVVAALLFVTVDLGKPWRAWRVLPGLGSPNFPASIMTWDILVLTLYLGVTMLLIWRHVSHEGDVPRTWMMLAALLGIAIHTVTAFLLAANPARPLWHTAILPPRFIASAFASGAGLMILALISLQRRHPLHAAVMGYLVRVMTFTLLIHLFLLGAELFTVFYRPTGHTRFAGLLVAGLEGSWVHGPWIWVATGLEGGVLLWLLGAGRVWPSRGLPLAAGLLVFGIWMEKGAGLVVPAFVPSPLGELAFYRPTWVEWTISAGIGALGLMVFQVLVQRVTGQGNKP